MISGFGLWITVNRKQKTKGAIGFDREVRVKEACRVTAYPKISGN